MSDIIQNPWSEKKWEEFLYFCCPECNEKSQSKENFINHALSKHPMSKACLETSIHFEVKNEEREKEEITRREVAIKSSNTFNVLSRIKRNKLKSSINFYENEAKTKSDDDPLGFNDPNSNDEKYNVYEPEIKIENQWEEEIMENDPIDYDDNDFIKIEDLDETGENIQQNPTAKKSKQKVKSKDRKSSSDPNNDKKKRIYRRSKDCPICGKTIKSKLQRHIETVHEGKRPIEQCPICGKEFRGSGYLKTHIDAIHNKIRKWKCEHCPLDFAHKQGFIDHVESIHKGLKWQCMYCEKSYPQRQALKRHKYTKHEDEINDQYKDEGTTFPCKVCQKVFFTAEVLKDHLQVHHQVRTIIENKNEYSKSVLWKSDETFECDECGKIFNLKPNLSRHKVAVHGSYICNICGKPSSNSGNLKKHIQAVHEESTKATCTICGKLFRDNTVLRFHIRAIHEGKKDHLCTECGKSFSKDTTLRGHLASIHSIGGKNNCEKCGKCFGTKYNLDVHVSSVHEGKRYQCDYCTKSFTQSQLLGAHCKKIHPDEVYTPKKPTLL